MVKLKNNHLYDNWLSQAVSWGHWFTLFNIFIVMILGSRYLIIADWASTTLGRFYAIISSIGHFSFLTFIVYLIILFPLAFLIRSARWYQITSIIVATIAISMLLIDIEIFSLFRMHLNFSIWGVLTSSDGDLLSAHWQKLFIFIPTILFFETVFAIWSWNKLRSLVKRKGYIRPIVIVFLLSFLLSHLIHIWADANFYRPITMQRSSLPLSYPMTARHFLERHGFLSYDKYQSQIEQEGNPFAMTIEYPLSKINFQNTQKPYNILMVVINDLQKQQLETQMPWLNQFANQNIRFNEHYSSSPVSYLNEFSLFYGLETNYYNSILSNHQTSVLIDTLTRQRYSLGLFSTDGFSLPLYQYALLSDFSMPKSVKRTNKDVTLYWLDWYQNQQTYSSPWFSLIQFKESMDNKKTLSPKHKAKRYGDIDNSLKIIVEKLIQNQNLNKTVIVIVSSNDIDISSKEDKFFAQSDLKTPLVIAWPDKASQVVNTKTSNIDVMQTIMQDVLNVTNSPKQYSQGQNLFSHAERNWLISGMKDRIAALYSDKSVVLDSFGHYQIYDIDGHQLESEKVNLSTFLQIVTQNRRFMVRN